MSQDSAVVQRAVLDALPLFLPALPFALVLGLAMIESGIDPWLAWSSSPIMFAGAAQLTLITLLGGGVAAAAAVGAALIVNARHLLYSAALAPSFREQPRWFRWFGPYLLIDQVFVLSMLRTNEDSPRTLRVYFLTIGLTFWGLWQLSTALGLFLGPAIPADWNLSLAVPILFLGILVIGIDRWPKAAAALVAAAVAVLLAGLPHRSGLLVGALAGVGAGAMLDRWRR